ncbi:MAG: Maf family protein [Woeseiaceae bacterium]
MAAAVDRSATKTGPAGLAPVILASASAVRSALLRAAGVPIAVDAAAIDEIEVKASLRAAQATAAAIAEALAELKAQRASRRHPGGLVIGADQVLECDGVILDKPGDLAEARRQLVALRGRRHQLLSAVVLVRDGQRLWHHVGRADLLMREFSEQFLDDYLRSIGDAALSSVGSYQIEGLGAQLFASIDGDYFTVLGLPLLPLLDILREHGALRS